MTASQLSKLIEKSGAVLYGNRVAVARRARIQRTTSGLFIPDTAVGRQNYGVVVMLGTGLELPVQVGDELYIPIYGGVSMEQPVGNDVYALEILHAKDVFISWKSDNDPELETGGQHDKDKMPKLERGNRL